jgi:cation diffusion facilitator CzcD-associated flavoprotein CzcO
MPSHDHVQAYLWGFAKRFDLHAHISFNHTVLSTSWNGNNEAGQWSIKYNDTNTAEVTTRAFDHLVVAAGRNYLPRYPDFWGVNEWLSGDQWKKRDVLHSIYYRDPRAFAGKTVLVLGGGPSGKDVAAQVSKFAKAVSNLFMPRTTSQVLIRFTFEDVSFFSPNSISRRHPSWNHASTLYLSLQQLFNHLYRRLFGHRC